jgi:hypothetical protein
VDETGVWEQDEAPLAAAARRHGAPSEEPPSAAAAPVAEAAAAAVRAPPRRWYCEGGFVLVMGIYALWSFANFMLDEVYALFALATLGLSASEIGSTSALTGLPLIAFQVVVFPLCARRLGARRTLALFGLVQAPAALALALSSLLRPERARLGAVVCALVVKTCVGSAGFTACFMLCNNCVAQERRGLANGIATVVSAVAKAFGPAIGAPLFAWSIGEARAGDGWARYGHALVFALAGSLCLATSGLVALAPASLDSKLDADAAHGVNASGAAEAGGAGGAASGGRAAVRVKSDGHDRTAVCAIEPVTASHGAAVAEDDGPHAVSR